MNYKIKNLTTEQIQNLKSEGIDFKGISRIDMGIEDINNGNIYSQEQVLNSLKVSYLDKEYA